MRLQPIPKYSLSKKNPALAKIEEMQGPTIFNWFWAKEI